VEMKGVSRALHPDAYFVRVKLVGQFSGDVEGEVLPSRPVFKDICDFARLPTAL